MQEVIVKAIDKIGFFVDVKAEVPDNLAKIINGLNKMCDDDIFKYKPHIDAEAYKKGIYKISIKTESVDNDIIEQVKNIATNEGCDVKIDTCYHWLVIKDKRQTINHYF